MTPPHPIPVPEPNDEAMNRPQILCYYFPDWHVDERTSAYFGTGWTEWDLLKAATPRFPGHRQPREPALGYFDEADPQVFETQIDLAVSHGVDGFLFDYYWYDDGPFLQRALDEGFLKAESRSSMTFALMWANHALTDIFPSRSADGTATVLKDGAIDRPAFEAMARHVTDRYFTEPNYLTVDGRPWFSVYEIGSLVAGLGGVDATKDALEWFDAHVRSRGFEGVHLDGIVSSVNELPGSTDWEQSLTALPTLGFRSATAYVWIHHAPADAIGFPAADWDRTRRLAFESFERIAGYLDLPFYPNVTVGWDSSPRTDQDVPFVEGAYPWIPTSDPEPEQFAQGLRDALDFLRRHRPPHSIVTVNAWNEWTEGSALLPDTVRGMRYLEALRDVLAED